MSDAYVGEIRMFGGNYAPQNWAMCNGQLLAISDNEQLFSLIGTTYGGDGRTNFGLPDLRGRLPLHVGTGYPLATKMGTEEVTLTLDQMPAHTHAVQAQSEPGVQGSPTNNVWAAIGGDLPYSTATPNAYMSASAVTSAGGSQPHDNMMPYLTITFIICLVGIYPTQN